MEFRQGLEPNLSSKQRGRQTRSYQQSSVCHQEHVGQIVKYLHVGDVSGLLHVLGKWSRILTKSSSRFIFVFQGMASSSVTALRDNTGFLLRHARCPLLHQANAMSFSFCVQGRFVISVSRSATLSRARFAMIWLSLRKSKHSKEIGSKHFPQNFHASQHRTSIPRSLFLQARNAVEAIESFAPLLSGVFRECSRIVCFLLALFRRPLNSASEPHGSVEKWSS